VCDYVYNRDVYFDLIQLVTIMGAGVLYALVHKFSSDDLRKKTYLLFQMHNYCKKSDEYVLFALQFSATCIC
jgi:hypothetical protein